MQAPAPSPGANSGQVAERRQLRLGLPDRVEKRRCALEPAQARPLDVAGASLGAKPVQLVAELFDVVVELYPCIAAEFLFANCGACGVEALERLIEAAVFAGARRENAVRFFVERSAQFGESRAGRRPPPAELAPTSPSARNISSPPARNLAASSPNDRSNTSWLSPPRNGASASSGRGSPEPSRSVVLRPLRRQNFSEAAVGRRDLRADAQLAGEARRIGRPLRHAEQEGADGGEGGRFARLVRPVDDMQPGVRPERDPQAPRRRRTSPARG